MVDRQTREQLLRHPLGSGSPEVLHRVQRPVSAVGNAALARLSGAQASAASASDPLLVSRAPLVSRAAAGAGHGTLAPAVSAAIRAQAGRGSPLPGAVQTEMEGHFGTDFSPVRVHTGTEAASLSRAVNAEAFTTGTDIFFGADRFRPESTAGRELLAHELTHVVQSPGPGATGAERVSAPEDASEVQATEVARHIAATPALPAARAASAGRDATPGVSVVSRSVLAAGNRAVALYVARQPVAAAAPVDEVAAASARLGLTLVADHPTGVSVALYDADRSEPEFRARATEWATREQAVALTRFPGTAKDVVIGRPMPDTRALGGSITALSRLLRPAVASVFEGIPIIGHLLGQLHPAARIRTVALFSHGTTDWASIGTPDLTKARVRAVARAIAPALTADAKVILYACSVARSPREASGWVRGTMDPGGEASLAGALRDELVAAGVPKVEVWGHTTVGHTSRNPALRVLAGDTGTGSAGQSYVSTYVFPPAERDRVVDEVLAEIRSQGYAIPDAAAETRTRNRAAADLRLHFYRAWVRASTDATLRFRGGPLAEMAPLHPTEVAALVRGYWASTYWTAALRTRVAKGTAKRVRLRK